jgi:hypothetical protein
VNKKENLVLIKAPNKYPGQPFMPRERESFLHTKVNGILFTLPALEYTLLYDMLQSFQLLTANT